MVDHTMGRVSIGWLAAVIGRLGAWFIYVLIWVFGRTRRRADIAWLLGPLGGKVIGDAPFQDVADAEGLSIERAVRDGGLVPSFEQLRGGGFDPAKAHPLVREFYEHTAAFAMDVFTCSSTSMATCAAITRCASSDCPCCACTTRCSGERPTSSGERYRHVIGILDQ